MIKTKVTVKDNTPELLKELQEKALRYVTEGGELIRSESEARCITGKDNGSNLKNSIKTEAFVENGKPTSETGPTATYAPYVEYGTGKFADPEGGGSKAKKIPWTYRTKDGRYFTTFGQVAQPFMRPGYEAALPKIERLQKAILGL